MSINIPHKGDVDDDNDNNNNNNNNNRKPCSQKVYYNSVGSVSNSHYETSFDDTLIRIRDPENDIRPEVTPKYTCVNTH